MEETKKEKRDIGFLFGVAILILISSLLSGDPGFIFVTLLLLYFIFGPAMEDLMKVLFKEESKD